MAAVIQENGSGEGIELPKAVAVLESAAEDQTPAAPDSEATAATDNGEKEAATIAEE